MGNRFTKYVDPMAASQEAIKQREAQIGRNPYQDDIGVQDMNEQDILRSLEPTANRFEKYRNSPGYSVKNEQYGPLEPPPPKGFFERVGDRFAKRDQALEAASENPDFLGGNAGLMYNAVGQNLQKGLWDVPTEAMVSAERAIPQPVKEYAGDVYSNWKDTIPGRVLDPALRGAGYVMGQAAEGYDKFQKNHPTAGLYLDSTLGFGNAALSALPVKGESLPSRTVGAGQTAATGAIAAADDVVKPFKRYAPQINSENARQIGGQLMESAKKSGAVINPEAAASFVDDVSRKIKPAGNWEAAATIKSEVDDIVESLAALRGQPMGLDDAMGLESRIGKLAYSPKNYQMGKFTPEGKQLLDIKHSLERMIENAADSGLVSGDAAAISTWREGQKYWSASVRARELENIIENAQYFDHPATAIRVGMRNILKNPNKIAKYSTAEVKAIKRAAKTGVVTDMYRLGASGLGPVVSGAIGGTVGTMIGGPVGGAVGAAAAAGPSFALREGSKAIAAARQTARGKKALDAVLKNSVGVPTKKLTMKQIMALPPEQAKLYLRQIK